MADDSDDVPQLDEFGLLRHHGEWVALSPVQESLMRRLLAHFGSPVARRELTDDLWPEAPTTRSIDTHMLRLRLRIAPLGLFIHTIRGRGFLLAPAQPRSTEART
jgi:DNA-binding response OmpR family regulator